MCIHAGAIGIKECVGKNEGYTKEEEEEEKNHVCFTHIALPRAAQQSLAAVMPMAYTHHTTHSQSRKEALFFANSYTDYTRHKLLNLLLLEFQSLAIGNPKKSFIL